HELDGVVALPAPQHLVDRDQVVHRTGTRREQEDNDQPYGTHTSSTVSRSTRPAWVTERKVMLPRRSWPPLRTRGTSRSKGVVHVPGASGGSKLTPAAATVPPSAASASVTSVVLPRVPPRSVKRVTGLPAQ